MNDRQLDMVLGYLNEGAEIDEYDYMLESLNEMMEYSINESAMITSLLERDIEDHLKNMPLKSSNAFEKVQEIIKRFINWVKSLITKLKIKIRQLSVSIISKQIKKQIEKQKAIIKDMDPDTTITLGAAEFALLSSAAEVISLSEKEIQEEICYSDNEFSSAMNDVSFKNIKDRLTLIGVNLFSKLPYPIFALNINLANKFSKDLKKIPKEARSITVEEYVDLLNALPALCDNVSNVLEKCLKSYNELIKFANDSYKDADKATNEAMKFGTRLTNLTTALSTAALRVELVALKLCKKSLKNAKSNK